MKKCFKKCLCVLSVAAVASIGVSAQAVPVSTASSQTLNAGGGASFTGVSVGFNSSLSTGDGSVAGGGGSDAYDGGNILSVGGTGYAPTTADLTGQTYTGDVQSIGGLDVTLQYHADATQTLLRSFAEFTNTTGAAIDSTITWQHNLGADGSTTIRSSSSGDTTFGTDDRWLVTSDGGPFDPVTSFYWYGPGTPQETTSSTFMTTTFNAAGDQGPRATYDISVGAGQTVSLLWYSGLTASNGSTPFATAQSLIQNLDNLALGDPLLSGISDQQLGRTLNWNFDGRTAVPEPITATLGLMGLGVLGTAARRRRTV